MRKNTPYKKIYKEPLSKKAKMKILGTIIFWLIFAIFVTCLFIINWPRIRTTMQNALWPAWFKSRTTQKNQTPVSPVPDRFQDESFLPIENSSAWDLVQPGEPESERTIRETPGVSVVSQPQPEPAGQANPVSPPPAPSPSVPVPSNQVSQPASQPSFSSTLRDRSLYFIQVDRDGSILRSKVTRSVPSSNSPLLDVLDVLLKGPTDEEKHRGLMSLIPQGTKILSARILKDTAYISISEDFQYNTYGVEGYAAQITQLIWTATEFTNVKDVQILIEGRRIDYLGEGIWIGSPISREML